MYRVQAAESQESLEESGYLIAGECFTLAEAKALARHYVSESYAKAAETTRLGYAAVFKNNGVIWDVAS